MLVAEYNKFVSSTDQSKERSAKDRHDIALYGLVGEIGSLISAVKKQLLREGGDADWDQPNDEIIEEIGDAIWYCFLFVQVNYNKNYKNILIQDIALLKKEIGANNVRATKIHAALDPSKKYRFLEEAEKFPRTQDMTFDHYQNLAFLTARTDGKILLEVCLAVLSQLSAEMLRKKLPNIELTLNKSVADRSSKVVLGEIAWHLAAIASLYHLSLDEVVKANVEKVSFRSDRGVPTPLHDELCDEDQQFPRKFEVSFVTIGEGKSRMYWKGQRLGNDLTDNSYDSDGYRFHDVMHLANAALLGWSPVLRGLMKRKRKRDKKLDEVEDGARAQIVEEAVIKAIHSEGIRLARQDHGGEVSGLVHLFPKREYVTFKLLKFIHNFLDGLEVKRNKYWEWEDTILSGFRVFYELTRAGQGTILVDLKERAIQFDPDVFVDIKGTVGGFGTHSVEVESSRGVSDARVIAAKGAILDAIGIASPQRSGLDEMTVKLLGENRVCVKATGATQKKIWDRKFISFRVSFQYFERTVTCTALALCDPEDAF